MPSTHLSLNFHVIFSTRNRVPEIAASWRNDLMPISVVAFKASAGNR